VTSLVRNIDSLEDSCRALRLMRASEQSLQDGEKKMIGQDEMESS
jgi:hypothetical protein